MQGKDNFNKRESVVHLLGHDFNISAGVNQSLQENIIFHSFHKESNSLF